MTTIISVSQNVHYSINYRHKVFSIISSNGQYENEQYFILKTCYNYSNKFYSIDTLPNIYIINYFSSEVNSTISYDMLEGWIIQRNGQEGDLPEFKCGIRIECTNDLDSTIRLLDYGINHLAQLINYKDSILSLHGADKPLKPYLSPKIIESAFNTIISKKKEAYIHHVTKEYDKKFSYPQ
jgi:hypothetical protein